MNLAERLKESRAGRTAAAPLPDPRTGNDSMVNPTGPPPDNYAEVRQEARAFVVKNLGTRLADSSLTDEDLRALVTVELQEALTKIDTPLSTEARARLISEIATDRPYRRMPSSV